MNPENALAPTDHVKDLASEIVRHLSISSIINPQGSPTAQDAVSQWCLAKLGVGNLHLPAGVRIPTADDNQFFSTFSASREPAMLRPLARLVERARPGLAGKFMSQFANRTWLSIDFPSI